MLQRLYLHHIPIVCQEQLVPVERAVLNHALVNQVVVQQLTQHIRSDYRALGPVLISQAVVRRGEENRNIYHCRLAVEIVFVFRKDVSGAKQVLGVVEIGLCPAGSVRPDASHFPVPVHTARRLGVVRHAVE